MIRFSRILKNLSPHFSFIIRKIYQELVIDNFFKIYFRRKIKKAKEIFEKSPEKPIWLGWDELEALQKKYQYKKTFIYDEKSLEHRGIYRALELINLTRARKKMVNKYLELGCGNGMVCFALKNLGKKATGIDITDEFDERAIKHGVKLVKMDASNLKFDDETFDVVHSYDAFEHFLDPEKVLKEAIRVVKKQGYIYLSFGLLYTSPWGPHAYRTITFPYWQFLFTTDLINEFIRKKGLDTLPDTTFNKWTIKDLRNLWKKYSNRLEIIRYKEIVDPRHLNLVGQYPSCFKSKTKNFDDLIVSSLEILFKKIK